MKSTINDQKFSSKINILILADVCSSSTTGGAERQILELCKHLNPEKFSLMAACLSSEDGLLKELSRFGVEAKTFHVKRIYDFNGIRKGLELYRILKKKKTDILMTYHFGSDIWGTIFGNLAGVPFIISNRRDAGFWRGKVHILAYKIFNPLVNKIYVVSKAVKSVVMKEEGVSENKIDVIYNGIDFDRFKNMTVPTGNTDQYPWPKNSKLIGFVGSLKPVKGHQYLIEAMAQVCQKFPNAHLLLIGAGSKEFIQSLRSQASSLGIESNVHFLGVRSDIPELLQRMDICVLSSLSEGMSNAILEYMAAGKPVVATDVGGNPELVVPGVTGYIVPAKSADGLAKAIQELLADERKCQTMGANGLKRIKESFLIEKMIAQYEQLFTQSFKKNHIKLLHLISSGGMFGAEQVILNMASHPNGVYSTVGALRNQHNPHLEIIDEANEKRIPTTIIESRGKFDLGAILKTRRYLIENRIDIVHTHNYKSDIVGGLAACLAGKKWIATNHGWLSTDQRTVFYEKFDIFVLRFARKIIAVSGEIAANLAKKKIVQDKVRIIQNGVDVGRFENEMPRGELKKNLGINEKDIVVSIVGRLSKEKGHSVFFSAAQKISADIKNVKFLVVGDGPLMNELKATATQLKLEDRIIFTGIRKDMPQIYAISDIVVNSSFMEGLPMTILEAMASRRPVIATRVGEVQQVIKDHKNGLLINSGDAEKLSEYILMLIQNPSQRKTLGEQAYIDVSTHFSAQRMALQYKDVYREVLGN